MPVNWDLLGPPPDIGGAIRQGFEYGRGAVRRAKQESAFARYAKSPNDPEAVAGVGAFDPVLGARLRADAKQQQFQSAFGEAYDPTTGAVDPVKARAAYAGAGDYEGAMRFDQGQASAAAAQREAGVKAMRDVARLLDDATDEPSYQQARRAAASMGLDISRVPEAYDPAWVDQQRIIVRNFIDKPEELTSFQRELAAAGIEPGSPDYLRMLENRYAKPQIIHDAAGNVLALGGGGLGAAGGGEAGDLFEALIQQESGGRPGVPGPVTEYGQPMGMTQMLPETAQEMAGKLGLPWRPEMLSGTSNEAADYQRRLGRAYFDEGLAKYGGDQRKALMYYHGGPDETLWGSKTRAYADAVLARSRGVSSTGGGGRTVTRIAEGKPPERPKPSETRVIKGQTYYKIAGRWFDNPEGR